MKHSSQRIFFVLLTFVMSVMSLSGCASVKRGLSKLASFASDKPSTRQVTQAELQDDLLRFESQFNAKIQNASQALEESQNPNIRYRAAMNRLIYSSNSLNIALGPSPESNLLDMVTFIELSHDVLRKYWIPNMFKEYGQTLDQAFLESKEQIWRIAEKVMTLEQRTQLQNVISAWRSRHPAQINVETVRLSEFSTEAGAKAAGLDESVGGLFASVQQSTESVDSAKLFAERALYFAERLPFLLRHQARLGVSEIIGDANFRFGQDSTLFAESGAMKSTLREFQQTVLLTNAMLGEANMTAKNLGKLAQQFSHSGSSTGTMQATLGQITSLLKELNQVLNSDAFRGDTSRTATVLNELRQEGNRLYTRLAWLGVGLITFFWAMYVVAKLTYLYFHRRIIKIPEDTSQHEHTTKAA